MKFLTMMLIVVSSSTIFALWAAPVKPWWLRPLIAFPIAFGLILLVLQVMQ